MYKYQFEILSLNFKKCCLATDWNKISIAEVLKLLKLK